MAQTPQEIAKEAVKLLTSRKLPPTPDNFQTVYHEVAGTRPLRPFPLENLRTVAKALPDKTPAQHRFKSQFTKAVSMHSWEDVEKVLTQQLKAVSTQEPPTHTGLAVVEEKTFPRELLDLTGRIVSHALPAVGNDDPKVVEQANELVHYLKLDSQHQPTLRKMMADFSFRLSFVAEEQSLIRSTLLSLLRSVLEHIEAISPDNPWLKEQMAVLVQAAEPPLSVRRLEDLQRRLKDLIHKQSEAREQTLLAQRVMKETLGLFLQRLAQTSAASSQYQSTFEQCATALSQASSLEEMAPVLQQAIQSARSLATDTKGLSDELSNLRERASEAEAEIVRLRHELDRMSEVASHDLLTGVLNRKGLLEVVEREVSRAERMGIQVCLALLDIDDFKKINDDHGHETGDGALRHLAQVAQSALRPQDSVARYGGEEFVVVLPDTTAEVAVEVITRLQRQLTTQLFMEADKRLLITFSAGVSEIRPDETTAQALNRADQAMYVAKRTGKNRVCLA